MRNWNLVIMGMKGSGKSVLSKHLLSYAPRAIVLDRMGEYTDGAIFNDWRESVEFWRAHLAADWHIIFRGHNPAAHLAWIDVLTDAQLKAAEMGQPLPPVALFVEESSFYSNTHNIGPILDALYTKGRHGYISVVSIVQRLTQIHPIIRDQSDEWITLRLRSFPSVVAERFTREDLERIPTLRTLTPDLTPRYGVHYLTDSGESDIFGPWARTLRERSAQRIYKDVPGAGNRPGSIGLDSIETAPVYTTGQPLPGRSNNHKRGFSDGD